MSWAEVQVLKDRQEPMYYKGKKVTRIDKCVLPELRKSTSVDATSSGKTNSYCFTPDGKYAYITLNEETGTFWCYRHDIDTNSLTLLEDNDTNTLETSSSYPTSGKMISSTNDTYYWLGSRTQMIKLKDFYMWLPLYEQKGTTGATVGGPKPKIGVTDTLESVIQKTSTPTHETTFTDLPIEAPSSTNQYTYLAITPYRVDFENNKFSFFLIKDWNSSLRTYTVELYEAAVNNDKTVSFTYIQSAPGTSTRLPGSGTAYYGFTTNIWMIDYKTLLFGDYVITENSNGNLVSRELTQDEKDIFSFMPLEYNGSYNNFMLVCRDKVLYKIQLHIFSGYTERVYMNTYYINGDKTWSYCGSSASNYEDLLIPWTSSGMFDTCGRFNINATATGTTNINNSHALYIKEDGALIIHPPSSSYSNDIYYANNNKNTLSINQILSIYETE